MPENIHLETPPSMATLVGGIVNDAQQLIRQEMLLARREVQQELDKTKTAAVSFGTAVAVLTLGALLLCFMLVYVLHEAAGLPLWGSFAVVGGVFAILGGILLAVAKNQASDISLVPRQTVETMRENVQWLKNQT
ncbi:MAG: phage holin family protein [Gemmataceae bacterium]|nr:phage holin family protein [Gemmataceae bacterium]